MALPEERLSRKRPKRRTSTYTVPFEAPPRTQNIPLPLLPPRETPDLADPTLAAFERRRQQRSRDGSDMLRLPEGLEGASPAGLAAASGFGGGVAGALDGLFNKFRRAVGGGEVLAPAGGEAGARAREIMDATAMLDAIKAAADEQGSGADGYGFTPLAEPSLDSYIAPYMQAEQAANEAYDASTKVIETGADQLEGRLNESQEQFEARQAEAAQSEALRRQFAAQQQEEILAPSGLAQELGVDPGIEAEGALLKSLAAQANTSQQGLTDRMSEAQAQDFQTRLESAAASEQNALAVASNNLSQLLQQIGLGKAEAERQHASDVNSIRNQNAQLESQARREYQSMVEAEEKARAQYETEQMKLVEGATKDAWELAEPMRAQKNKKAMEFFDYLTDTYGRSKDSASMREALRALPEEVAAWNAEMNTSLNPRVLAQWVQEFYGNKRVFDPEAFLQAGGDPAIAARVAGQ